MKCKAFLADYTHGEFKKESRLLLQAIEAGVPKAIDVSDNLSQCKQQQIRVLKEDYFLAEEIAKDIIDNLALILRNLKEQTTESSQIISTSNEINKQIPTKMVKEDQIPLYWLPLTFFILFVIIFVIFTFFGHNY